MSAGKEDAAIIAENAISVVQGIAQPQLNSAGDGGRDESDVNEGRRDHAAHAEASGAIA